MGLEFTPNDINTCSLCGSSGPLTGEHKIKASLIRQEFGNRVMSFFGRHCDGKPKFAQSAKSKFFYFDSKICMNCNSNLTQPADLAFDILHNSIMQDCESNDKLDEDGSFPVPSSTKEELDVFRYFAKILCCFMAEVGGPRPRTIALFAIGKSDFNPIFLNVRPDEGYKNINAMLDSRGFAQHGGLKFLFDEKKLYVTKIISSVSIGRIKYEFWVQLNLRVAIELDLVCPNLIQVARSSIERLQNNRE